MSIASKNHKANVKRLPSTSQIAQVAGNRQNSFFCLIFEGWLLPQGLDLWHITNPVEQKRDPNGICSKCSLLTMGLCFLDIV